MNSTCIISALRISVLSTMDFADITYTMPKANIFSGIEPCLAVILASVPMMRPLLGRTGSTPNATGQTPISLSKQSGGVKGSHSNETGDHDDGFERLDDDTSQLWLRPMGPKHYAGISVRHDKGAHGDGLGDVSGGSLESLEQGTRGVVGRERSTSGGGGGITVKQEWVVEERRAR
jgi:hypothetical protein